MVKQNLDKMQVRRVDALRNQLNENKKRSSDGINVINKRQKN